MWLWFGKDLVEYIGRKFLWIYSRMRLWEGRCGEGKGGELSRKSMHLIRIEIIDKKFALISTMKIKNALELVMGGVGGVGGGG